MLETSLAVMTASSSTSQKSPIFLLMSWSRNRSVRQRRMSGWMPIARRSLTLCCVGLVFSSPAAPMNGTSVRWMKSVLSRPTSWRSWRIASRNGRLSMSPTVPPISTSAMSTSLRDRADAVLDLVGDVRNHLDGAAEIVAAPLLLNDRLVDLARRPVVVPGRRPGW